MSRTYNRCSRAQDLRIIELHAEGKTHKEIAAELQITKHMVKYRIERLRETEGALSTVHLVTMLILNGFIAPVIRLAKS